MFIDALDTGKDTLNTSFIHGGFSTQDDFYRFFAHVYFFKT